MSLVSKLYENVAIISPKIEVMMRKLYWKNVKHLKRFRPYNAPKKKELEEMPKVDFSEIESYLRTQGIGEGSLIVVHSSYDHLSSTGLSPEEIVERLLKLIGPSGTLAMPAMRKYKGEPEGYDRLTVSTDDLVCTYKPRKTMVKTGWLPLAMVQRKDSVVSRHPLDTMVAIGPLAKAMMEHNLDGEAPASHGPNSSWKFCYDHSAIVVGLGVPLIHYNSISHVFEEGMGNWFYTDEEWYRLRKFHIIDEDFDKIVMVKERKPEWGMMRNVGVKFNKDIYKKEIIKHTFVGAVEVSVEDPREYMAYYASVAKRGYPYI